jgi:hypothetical protein
MTEDVVEDVRLLEVIHFLLGPNERACGEAPIGQMIEKDLVRHESGHRHHAPAGEACETVAHPFHVGNAGVGELQHAHHLHELIAGPALQDRL